MPTPSDFDLLKSYMLKDENYFFRTQLKAFQSMRDDVYTSPNAPTHLGKALLQNTEDEWNNTLKSLLRVAYQEKKYEFAKIILEDSSLASEASFKSANTQTFLFESQSSTENEPGPNSESIKIKKLIMAHQFAHYVHDFKKWFFDPYEDCNNYFDKAGSIKEIVELLEPQIITALEPENKTAEEGKDSPKDLLDETLFLECMEHYRKAQEFFLQNPQPKSQDSLDNPQEVQKVLPFRYQNDYRSIYRENVWPFLKHSLLNEISQLKKSLPEKELPPQNKVALHEIRQLLNETQLLITSFHAINHYTEELNAKELPISSNPTISMTDKYLSFSREGISLVNKYKKQLKESDFKSGQWMKDVAEHLENNILPKIKQSIEDIPPLDQHLIFNLYYLDPQKEDEPIGDEPILHKLMQALLELTLRNYDDYPNATIHINKSHEIFENLYRLTISLFWKR